jgi:hypothetical protein
MQKTTKLLGFISLFFFVSSITILIQYLIQSSSPDAGWAALGFFLIAAIMFILALILTIPFLIFLFKVKFRNMKFYAFSHLSFLIFTIFLVLYSLNF